MIWDITFKQMSSSSGSAPDIPPFFTSNTEWHPVRVLATEHWRFVAKALPPSEASGCWCCCVVCSPTALRLLSASDSKLSVQIRGPSFFHGEAAWTNRKNAGFMGFDMISWDSMANADFHEISWRFHWGCGHLTVHYKVGPLAECLPRVFTFYQGFMIIHFLNPCRFNIHIYIYVYIYSCSIYIYVCI